jgi:hypothetical protein
MSRPTSILFLTTVNLTANPRLYKETELALRNGFDVTVILFSLGNWGDDNDRSLEERIPGARLIRISALRRPFLPWLVSSLLQTCALALSRFLDVAAVNAAATGKRYILLRHAVHALEGRFDWVIGHNPAALHAAVVAARRFDARLGLDIEDYHPFETSDPVLSETTRRMMRDCLKQADYASYASPLIREHSDRYAARPEGNGIEVLNYFPADEFPVPPDAVEGPLRLVWFSQHIRPGRGLDLVLPGLSAHPEAVELHLYGQPDDAYVRHLTEGRPNVRVHGPLSQTELHRSLGRYDVGLAVDILSDRNRDIAVTNKILAFLQSGLFLAVTETSAQRRLLGGFGGHGLLFPPDAEAFTRILASLIERKEMIRSERTVRHAAMSGHDWEAESVKLLTEWGRLLEGLPERGVNPSE